MAARACVLLLVFCVGVRAGVLSAKGFYCQDPDTGHLHSVNTTWPSTTFCGNYTCKIRVRSQDMDHAASRTIINITRPVQIVEQPAPKESDAFYKSKENGIETNIYNRNNSKDGLQNINLPFQNKDEDRFLNGEEIKVISELLHTVKKSDLEAIIEIYNLAQDIYKEMDQASNESAITEAINGVTAQDSSKKAKSNEIKNVKNDYTSYWYEPLSSNGYRNKQADMRTEGTEYRPTSTIPHEAYYTSAVPQSTPPTYFSGTLLNNEDFGRLAYYYPLSNFQRVASYYHNHRSPYEAPIPQRSPCNSCPRYQYTTERRDDRRLYNYPQKPSEPAVLLPIPFSYDAYNGTGYGYYNYNNYYKGNPWAYYDYYKNSAYQPSPTELAPKSVILVNPEINNVQNDEQKPVEREKNSILHEKQKDESKSWQTDPLPEAVIEGIRANIEERAKLLKIPLKKRIKLERVAKVIKLDHLNRHTRKERNVDNVVPGGNTQSTDVLETYIEKTTCAASSELGYFRVGNISQPFPACCPQKIEGT